MSTSHRPLAWRSLMFLVPTMTSAGWMRGMKGPVLVHGHLELLENGLTGRDAGGGGRLLGDGRHRGRARRAV